MSSNAVLLLEYISNRYIETENHPFWINLNPLLSREEGKTALRELEEDGYVTIYQRSGPDHYLIDMNR